MKVLPVIHHLTIKLSIEQAKIALAAGADGVFLISHGDQDDELDEAHLHIKSQFPDAFIGVNYLSVRSPSRAFSRALKNEYSAVWIDNVGICDGAVSVHGAELLAEVSAARLAGDIPQVFGSVAFKYQRETNNPSTDAYIAHRLGYIATTSGARTGLPPEFAKIVAMSQSTGGTLAVASGLTPENLSLFKLRVSHALVSTGISKDEHRLDEHKLHAFIQVAKG